MDVIFLKRVDIWKREYMNMNTVYVAQILYRVWKNIA